MPAAAAITCIQEPAQHFCVFFVAVEGSVGLVEQ
jgi:hypothetical protein